MEREKLEEALAQLPPTPDTLLLKADFEDLETLPQEIVGETGGVTLKTRAK